MSSRLHPIDGMREDFTAFLKDFVASKSLRFRIFAQVWRDRRFSFLSCGRQTISKTNDFFNCLFHQLVQFIQPPHELEAQVCAFYMLYGFYFKQPVQNHVRIRVTSKEWSVIVQLVANMRREAHWDLVYIFHVLCASKAFHFCATLQPFYPSVPSYACTPLDPLPMCDGKSMSTVIGLDRLQMLSDIHQRYQTFKRNLPSQREAAEANKVGEEGLTADLDLVRPAFFPDLIDKVKTSDKELKDTFRDFRKLFSSHPSLRRGDVVDVEEESETEEEYSDNDEDESIEGEEEEGEDEQRLTGEEDNQSEEEDTSEYWRNRISRMAVSRQPAMRQPSSDLSDLPIGERRQALKRKRFGGQQSPSMSPTKSPKDLFVGPEGNVSRQSSTVSSALESPPEQSPRRKSRQKTTPKAPKERNNANAPSSSRKRKKAPARQRSRSSSAASRKKRQINGSAKRGKSSLTSATRSNTASTSVNGSGNSGDFCLPEPYMKRKRTKLTSEKIPRLPNYISFPSSDEPTSPEPGPSGISKR